MVMDRKNKNTVNIPLLPTETGGGRVHPHEAKSFTFKVTQSCHQDDSVVWQDSIMCLIPFYFFIFFF